MLYEQCFTVFITHVSPNIVCDHIADIHAYQSWLPDSDTFSGIHHISDQPVKSGTSYRDGQGQLEMRGTIAIFDPPNQIKFEQSSRFKALGVLQSGIMITIDYIFVQEHNGTTVIRNYSAEFYGILKPLSRLAIRRIRRENERVLQVLKSVLEKTT